MKEKQSGIPIELLNKINEHTSGGFIIFFVNAQGDPDCLSYIDNSTLARGIVSFIEDTVESIRLIEKDARISTLSVEDNNDEI